MKMHRLLLEDAAEQFKQMMLLDANDTSSGDDEQVLRKFKDFKR